MRLIRWLVAITVLLVVAALVAGEVIARPMAERAVAREVQRRYQLEQQPTVHLAGFPFLVRVALGHLPSATGELQGTSVQGLRVDDAQLHLTDIRFDPGRIAGGGGQVKAQQGTASATVTDVDLNRFLQSHNIGVQVAFQAGRPTAKGRVTIEGVDVDVSASGELSLNGTQLHFQADKLSALNHDVPASVLDRYRDRLGFTVTVPPVAGVQLTSLVVEDGRIRLAADVTGYLLAGKAPPAGAASNS